MIDLERAYARCEEITRVEARNFSYGIRLLPEDKRRAMSVLYAFARRVDDIGDGGLGTADKLVALAGVRQDIDRAANGEPAENDPVLVALTDVISCFPISTDALGDLVSGCELDCQKSRYATFEELSIYCGYVAGSIGRLSLGVFGSSDERAPHLSNTLGIGLQITNILRDIVEDREVMGRVYIPSEDLERFGCNSDASGPDEALDALVRFEAGRARARYEEGLQLLDLLDRRSRSCVSAMAGIYYQLLLRIERDPRSVFARRVSVPAWEKIWVATRSLAGVSR